MVTKKTITFTINSEIVEELKAIRESEGTNLSYIAQELFVEWLCIRNKVKE